MVPGENNMMVTCESENASTEQRFICVIRDMTDANTQTRFSLTLPASITCYKLIEEVGRSLGYDPTSFLLCYEQPTESKEYSEVTINDIQSSRLDEVLRSSRNNFTVMEKDGPPIKHLSEEGTESSDVVSFSLDTKSSYSSPGSYGPHTNPSGYSYSSSLTKSDTGFVGLVNQAMTCYLSSLLQTLFMTPEFRNAVYRWEFDGTEEEAAKSIPYQLQKLFLQLQTSKKRAVETTDITKSFGWDSSEAWQQHDVQELCRVMFDALERTWSKTGQGDLINKLYQGKMKDYVKCLECGYESARTDTYLDIPLVIRPFGSNKSYHSVEEAIRGFVEPEILDGNNQYFCSYCDKKCDAHKGLKFLSFPYLLTLQLKRFDFDYVSLHRIKLNDRVTFPDLLMVNDLIEGSQEDEGLPSKDKESHVNGADLADQAIVHSPGATSSLNHLEQNEEAVDEGIDIGYSASGTSNTGSDVSSLGSSEAATNDRNLKDSQSRGLYEYELFSIMVHSGSAAGGHYYAYIKSFTDSRWYSFNDQHVSTITYDDIKKTYGGSHSGYSSAYTSSTNAYMLMYRQIDKEGNAKFYTLDTLPQHLKDALETIRRQEEAEKQQRELDKNLCKIRVFCFHPEHSKLLESRLVIHKDKTLKEATKMTWQLFELEKIVPTDCCRLIKYDEAIDYINQSFDDKDGETIGDILGGVKYFYSFELLLELKQPGEIFQDYKPGGVTVKVHIVDLANETIGAPITMRAYLTQTYDEFRNSLSQVLQINAERLVCVRERYYNDLRLLSTLGRTLKAEGFSKSNKLFVECSGTDEYDKILFPETRLFRLLDRYENTIRMHITLPPYIQASVLYPPPKSNNVKSRADNTAVDCGTSHDQGNGDSSENCTPMEANTDIHNNIGDAIYQEHSKEKFTDNSQPSQHVQNNATRSEVNSVLCVSPDDSTYPPSSENWDLETDDRVTSGCNPGSILDDEYRRYFTAQLHVNTESTERNLTVYVDKRITLGSLKREFEQYVGTTGDNFKVYRVYSNSQEVEVSKLSDTLSTYSDDSKLIVKLGRALKKGEYRVKVFQLTIDQEEVFKLLFETIFARGMTVGESKALIQQEMKLHCDMDIPVDRIRLRKKSWKNPTKIYQNEQVYEQDITILSNWEIFLEILEGAEPVRDVSQLSVYLRRWSPSTYTLGPLQEIILTEQTLKELRQKIAEVGNIPDENVEYAKAKGTFPCDMCVLDIHADMEWNPPVTALNMYPLSVCEDGAVLYYRDKTEALVELSDARKKELQQRESNRLSYASRIHYSARKERALKIYTDDSPRRDGTATMNKNFNDLD